MPIYLTINVTYDHTLDFCLDYTGLWLMNLGYFISKNGWMFWLPLYRLFYDTFCTTSILFIFKSCFGLETISFFKLKYELTYHYMCSLLVLCYFCYDITSKTLINSLHIKIPILWPYDGGISSWLTCIFSPILTRLGQMPDWTLFLWWLFNL